MAKVEPVVDNNIEQYVEDIHNNFTLMNLPGYMWAGIERFLKYGIIPGDFLCSVFSNKLLSAFAHADTANTEMLDQWVLFVGGWMPHGAVGSTYRFEDWLKKGGLYGKREHRLQKEAERKSSL